MKKLLFICMLLFSFSSYSQFTNLMGSLSVQGVITAGSTEKAAQGIYAVRKTKLLEIIRQAAMEIRSQFNGNYDGVGPSNISEDLFYGLEWYIGQVGYHSFFIQINDIDTQSCRFLLSSPTSARLIELNGDSENKECSGSNNIKFIFD